MNKFFCTILFVLTLFLCQSCVWNLGNDYFVDEAKDFLTDNFDDTFTYESISKNDNKTYVRFKASNLNNTTVTVQITEEKESLISVSHSFKSNYLCCRFAQQEASYYEDFFEEYFSECRITIDNSNRFIDYHGVWYVLEESSGEWIEHTNRNPDFETYLNIIKDSKPKNCITIVVTSPGSNVFLTNEDLLKASLADLQQGNIKLDGNFYIVNSMNDNYEQNHVMAAKIIANDNSKYKYNLLQ